MVVDWWTMKNIIQALNWRYSTQKFDTNKKLSKEQVETLLEVLRLTPSSFGLQAWKFVLVENPETRTRLREAAWGQAQVTEASHLLVLCRLARLEESWLMENVENTAKVRKVEMESLRGYEEMIKAVAKKKSEEQTGDWMDKQVYIALGNLLTSCAMMEIDACPMEGFDKNKFDEILGLGEMGLKSVLVCPVGFRSETDSETRQVKVRFELEKVVVKK